MRPLLTVTLLIVLVFAGTLATRASTLDDYRERLTRARVVCDQLIGRLDQRDATFERDVLARLDRLIPETETVSWPDGSVETDNRWLRTRLADFRSKEDREARRSVLTEISERLGGISSAVEEFAAGEAAEQTKDRDKQKLAEILSRVEYQKPQPPEESMFQRWMREFLEWLTRSFPKTPVTPAANEGVSSLQYVLLILVGAVVLAFVSFLLYKLLPYVRGGGLFRRTSSKEDRVILGERIGADESASDLFAEAEQLALGGNLRAAIRKGYVAVLCELGDRKLLRLGRHRTNRDYLRELGPNRSLYKNMADLTGQFERNWYGLREAQPADWAEFREAYQQTVGAAAGKDQGAEA